MDCNPLGSSVHGILQARRLEWLPCLSPGIFPTQESNPGLLHSRQILYHLSHQGNFPGGTSGKEPTCQCRRQKRQRFNPWVRKIPWRREWQPTPAFLPGEFHGQRSLVRYSPWGCKELNTTEQLTQKLLTLEQMQISAPRRE